MSSSARNPAITWHDRPRRDRILILSALVVAYVAASRLGLSVRFDGTIATAVWPASGIALAAALAWGWRTWPGVFVGAWIVNFMYLDEHAALGWGAIGANATAIAVGNTLEVLAGWFALLRIRAARPPFESVHVAFKFLFVAVAAPVAAASAGVIAMWSFGVIGESKALESWVTWWLGDAVGILVFTPLLLAWSRRWDMPWTPRRIAEAVVLGLSLVPTGFILFGGGLPEPMVRSLPYLVMPLLLWAVLRFGVREATTAVTLVAAIATWGTARGQGPFAAASLNESLLLVQSFVGTVAVTVLMLGAALQERRLLNEALRDANRSLEDRVAERTEQLSTEVAERRKAEETVRHMAQHDSLTGLANRRLLGEVFDSIEVLARRRDGEMAVLFIDIDDFKPINDELGHDAGDAALVTVASRLEAAVRESDIVARFGGDEFVVVLPDLTKADDAELVAGKVKDALTQPLRVAGATKSLGVSIGIATYPRDARDLDGLVRCADRAMYRAKEAGKNGIAFYGA